MPIAFLRVATNTAALALPGGLVNLWTAVLLGAVGLGSGLAHAAAIVATESYPGDPRGRWLLLVDHTWSLPNTVLGSLFLALNRLRRNPPDAVHSRHRTTVVLRRGVLAGFATTIGNVEAGTAEGTAAHEYVHVLQARLFGPAYLPLVAVGYLVAALLPYWWPYHDHEQRPIRSLRDYLVRGVYPHTWHEQWAYAVEGSPPP